MSHELRTPLNGILGMAELAQTPDHRREAGRLPRQAGHVGGGTCWRWSATSSTSPRSKPTASRFSRRCCRCPPDRRVPADAAGGPRRQKGLSVARHVDPALEGPLWGDATRIRQVLINFIDNAISSLRRGASSCGRRRSSRMTTGITVRLEVTDEGIGIRPADQARLFQPFQQVDDSLTRRYGGTGLGLSIAQRLARLMGGDVGVHSQEGRAAPSGHPAALAGRGGAACRRCRPPACAKPGPPLRGHPGAAGRGQRRQPAGRWTC